MTDITFKPDQYVKFKDGVDVSQYGEEPGTMYVFALYSSIDPNDCLIGEPWAEDGIYVDYDEIRPATEQEIAEYEGKAND